MKKFSGFMHGVDIGGWLSQCDYSKERLDSFIGEEDFSRFKAWGLDHVRLPVDYNILQDEQGFIESGFEYIQKAIDLCGANGLNMILDLHKTMGYFFDKAQAESGFFDSEELQQRFYDLWEQFALRFGGYSDRLAFELLNEVTDPSFCDSWNRISRRTVEIIRSRCPDIKIIIGGYWNNSIDALADLDMPYDENIVYTFHCYDPFIFTHQGAYWVDGMPADFRMPYPAAASLYQTEVKRLGFEYMQSYEAMGDTEFSEQFFIDRFAAAVKLCEQRGVALYCGEYGVIEHASPADTLCWYKHISSAFDRFGIGRAAWAYKGVDFGLSDKHLEPVIDELVKYL